MPPYIPSIPKPSFYNQGVVDKLSLLASSGFNLATLSVAQQWEEAVDEDGFANHPQLEHWFDPRMLVGSITESGRVGSWSSLKDPSVQFRSIESDNSTVETGPFLRGYDGNSLINISGFADGLVNYPFINEPRFIGAEDSTTTGDPGSIQLIGMTPIAPPWTIAFVVYNFNYLAGSGQNPIIERLDGSALTRALYYRNNDRYCLAHNYRIADDGQPTVQANGVYLVMFEADPANNRVTSWLNDPDTGYTETNDPLNGIGSLSNGMTINPLPLTHTIGELALFSGKLSSQDRANLFNRIKTRNGIS